MFQAGSKEGSGLLHTYDHPLPNFATFFDYVWRSFGIAGK